MTRNRWRSKKNRKTGKVNRFKVRPTTGRKNGVRPSPRGTFGRPPALSPDEYVSELSLQRVREQEDGNVKYWMEGRDGMIASLVHVPARPTEMSIRVSYPAGLTRYDPKSGGRMEIRGDRSIMENLTFDDFRRKVVRDIRAEYQWAHSRGYNGEMGNGE